MQTVLWSCNCFHDRVVFCVSKNLRSCTPPSQREGRKTGTPLAPFEHSPKPLNFTFLAEGQHYSSITDTITPFHRYMMEFGLPAGKHDFPELPFLAHLVTQFRSLSQPLCKISKTRKSCLYGSWCSKWWENSIVEKVLWSGFGLCWYWC